MANKLNFTMLFNFNEFKLSLVAKGHTYGNDHFSSQETFVLSDTDTSIVQAGARVPAPWLYHLSIE